MKYTHFEYKPSSEMRKKFRGRQSFWIYYGVAMIGWSLFFARNEDNFARHAMIVVPTYTVLYMLLIPYVVNRIESRKERKAQKTQQQD